MFEYIDFEQRDGENNLNDVKLFGLSTCAFCKRAIIFLDENDIKYELVFLDKINIKEKLRVKEEFYAKFNERMNLPTLVLNENDYLIGFIRVAWERVFPKINRIHKEDISQSNNEASRVSKFVEASAKYKNWFVNPDKNFRHNLEEGLLINLKRYGYYHCPCRDSDNKNDNSDIRCPCKYAEKDIIEWGQCFCGLFVSKELFEAKKELGSIPERRKV